MLFGVGLLIYRVESGSGPGSVLIGMLTLAVVTSATIASAVLVARTGRVRGPARWVLLLVAADAVLIAAMSTVPAEGLVLVYLGAHLELIRPLTLLVWGAALTLQATEVRRRLAAADASWKRTTEIGGSSPTDRATPTPDVTALQVKAD